MVKPTVEWYHVVLGHPGEKRLDQSIKGRYFHPQLRKKCENVVKNCEFCQRHKRPGRGFGLLPEREVKVAPFEEIAVDLIGPWKTKVAGKVVTFNSLTIIDTVTNLVELVRIDNKSMAHIRQKFEQAWLSRYPWPRRVVHDKGEEFIGNAFAPCSKRTLHLLQRTLSQTVFVNACTKLSATSSAQFSTPIPIPLSRRLRRLSMMPWQQPCMLCAPTSLLLLAARQDL